MLYINVSVHFSHFYYLIIFVQWSIINLSTSFDPQAFIRSRFKLSSVQHSYYFCQFIIDLPVVNPFWSYMLQLTPKFLVLCDFQFMNSPFTLMNCLLISFSKNLDNFRSVFYGITVNLCNKIILNLFGFIVKRWIAAPVVN